MGYRMYAVRAKDGDNRDKCEMCGSKLYGYTPEEYLKSLKYLKDIYYNYIDNGISIIGDIRDAKGYDGKHNMLIMSEKAFKEGIKLYLDDMYGEGFEYEEEGDREYRNNGLNMGNTSGSKIVYGC